MIIPWTLLIAGLAQVALGDSSSKEEPFAVIEPGAPKKPEPAAESTPTTPIVVTGDAIDGVPLSQLDDVPALSVPSSSEEISNDPKTSSSTSSTTTTTAAATTEAPTTPPTSHAPTTATIPVTSPPTTIEAKSTLNITEEDRNGTDTTPQPITKKITSKRPLSDILSKLSRTTTPAVDLPINESVIAFNISFETNATTNAASSATTLSEAEQKQLPSVVRNIRVSVIGYTGKPVHTFNLTEKQILYQVRIFWMEPENWRDRGFRPPNRLYDVFCWLSNDGSWVHDLIRQNFSLAIFNHAQWFSFPEAEADPKANLTVDCGIRAINSGDKASEWGFSVPVEISEVPVFLRGFDNVNVKGWTPEEVTHLLKTSSTEAKRRDTPIFSRGGNARGRC